MMDIAKLAIAPGLLLMVAENVPKLNVVPSCQTAGRESIVAGRNFYTCVADEHAARDKLGPIWHYYTPVEKSQCTQTTSIGGSPSYIELTVCLEFMKEARERKALIPAVRER